MKSILVSFMISLRGYVVFTVLLGLIYPFLIMGIGQLFFKYQADGSLIRYGSRIVGSQLLAQRTEGLGYFWPRPSAVDYNPLASGGSNLGPTSLSLSDAVKAREAKFGGASVPQELLFASGSGLDPEISMATALFQVERISNARGVSMDKLRTIVSDQRKGRQLGFLGEETVNVLNLNLAIDREFTLRK